MLRGMTAAKLEKTKMKYNATIVFNSENEESAILAFQNAACQMNAAPDIEPLEIAHIKVVLNGDIERPSLVTLQILHPEDFSTFTDGK